MTVTPQNARKEIFERFDTTWAAKAGVIVGGDAPEVRYKGDERKELPGSSKYWARASTQMVDTRQAAHQMPEAPDASNVIYATAGVVIIQIFAPMSERTSYGKGELLAELAQCIFMATETPSAVWFRNPRINELDDDGTWYRWNVIADYQFDQKKGS